MALPVWAGAKAEQPAMAVAARIADFIMVLYLFSVKSERSQWVVEDPPSTRKPGCAGLTLLVPPYSLAS